MVVHKHIPSVILSLSAGCDAWVLENIPALTELLDTSDMEAMRQPSMKSSPSYLKLRNAKYTYMFRVFLHKFYTISDTSNIWKFYMKKLIIVFSVSSSQRHKAGRNKSYFCVSERKLAATSLKYCYYLVWQYSAWIHQEFIISLVVWTVWGSGWHTHMRLQKLYSFAVAEKNGTGSSSLLPVARPDFEGFCHLNML